MGLIGRMCNGAKFDSSTNGSPLSERKIKGDPTDTAVLRYAENAIQRCLSLSVEEDALLNLGERFNKTFEIPFNSRNKWMTSVVEEKKVLDDEKEPYSEPWLLIKGAPDILFPSVSYILNSDGASLPFDDAARAKISLTQGHWSSEGQRVIAVCKRSLDSVKLPEDHNEREEVLYNEIQELTLVGLISIRDPPRPDVKTSIGVIRDAGVRVFMVTGDFKLTAVAIAKQVRPPGIHILID